MTESQSQFEYTNLEGNCPNPVDVLVAQYTELAQKVKELVCAESAQGKAYVDGKIDSLQTQIVALTNNEDLILRIEELQEFLNSLDSNGDGTIDVIVNLQAQLDELKGKVAALEAKANSNATNITALDNKLNNFQNTTNGAINTINGGLLDAKNQASNALQTARDAQNAANNADQLAKLVDSKSNVNSADISGLRAQIAQIVSFDDEKARQLAQQQTCYIFATMRDALGAAISAFSTEIATGCNVYGNDQPPVTEDAPPA